ncbi:MAG: hypothetical protein L0Y71_12865, partial [Gemmataceae bacterium]|nr:hypothetical protein [Gemmataceae bacterium]
REATTRTQGGMIAELFAMPDKESDRLLERGLEYPTEVCNLLRARALKRGQAPSAPSANGPGGKRKKHRRR